MLTFSAVYGMQTAIYIGRRIKQVTGTDLSGYGSPATTGYATTPQTGTATTESNNGTDWFDHEN